MVALILGMVLCIAVAAFVVVLVAAPARKEGKDLLTQRGEQVVGAMRERTRR